MDGKSGIQEVSYNNPDGGVRRDWSFGWRGPQPYEVNGITYLVGKATEGGGFIGRIVLLVKLVLMAIVMIGLLVFLWEIMPILTLLFFVPLCFGSVRGFAARKIKELFKKRESGLLVTKTDGTPVSDVHARRPLVDRYYLQEICGGLLPKPKEKKAKEVYQQILAGGSVCGHLFERNYYHPSQIFMDGKEYGFEAFRESFLARANEGDPAVTKESLLEIEKANKPDEIVSLKQLIKKLGVEPKGSDQKSLEQELFATVYREKNEDYFNGLTNCDELRKGFAAYKDEQLKVKCEEVAKAQTFEQLLADLQPHAPPVVGADADIIAMAGLKKGPNAADAALVTAEQKNVCTFGGEQIAYSMLHDEVSVCGKNHAWEKFLAAVMAAYPNQATRVQEELNKWREPQSYLAVARTLFRGRQVFGDYSVLADDAFGDKATFHDRLDRKLVFGDEARVLCDNSFSESEKKIGCIFLHEAIKRRDARLEAFAKGLSNKVSEGQATLAAQFEAIQLRSFLSSSIDISGLSWDQLSPDEQEREWNREEVEVMRLNQDYLRWDSYYYGYKKQEKPPPRPSLESRKDYIAFRTSFPADTADSCNAHNRTVLFDGFTYRWNHLKKEHFKKHPELLAKIGAFIEAKAYIEGATKDACNRLGYRYEDFVGTRASLITRPIEKVVNSATYRKENSEYRFLFEKNTLKVIERAEKIVDGKTIESIIADYATTMDSKPDAAAI